MTRLIFCSFEVGGLPFRMAELLNRSQRPTLYVSVARSEPGAFDSTRRHHPGPPPPWDLSARFQGLGPGGTARELRTLDREHGPLACLGVGGQAHLLARAGLPYGYWSYGSDLDQSCFAPPWPQGYPLWKRAALWPRFLLHERIPARRSVRLAREVCIAAYQEAELQRVAPGKALFFLPHLLPVRPWESVRAGAAQAAERVAGRIGPGPFVFSATRHVWCGALARHHDRKGNDVLIRAFALYARSCPGQARPVRLVLVRKGPDVKASAALAQDLGVAPRVCWVDEMGREELNDFYAAASVCLGQFATPVLTYAALDPLVHGTPSASFFFQPPGVPWYGSPPPLANTADPEALAAFLARMLEAPEERLRLGRAGWEWLAANCAGDCFARAMDALAARLVEGALP